MKRLLGFILFWIGIGMCIMLFMRHGLLAVLIIIACLVLFAIVSPILCTELENNEKIRLLKTGNIKTGEDLYAVDIYE